MNRVISKHNLVIPFLLYIGSKKSCELDFDQLVLGAQMELEKKLDM